MKNFLKKKKPGHCLIYACLLIEIGISTYSFLCTPQGIQQLYALWTQQTLLQTAINNENSEILQIEKSIHQWQQCTFYKEKVAREQLQMACPNEIIYYMPQQVSST